MANVRTEKEYQAIMDELMAQTDRGVAIIAAGVLEEHLTAALQQRLILTKPISERIFSIDRRGFASEFGQKVDLAYCVGLLRKSGYDDLRLIARIRNRFAHHIEPLQFSESTIAGWVRDLKTQVDDTPFTQPRLKYISTCALISMILHTQSATPTLRITAIREDPKLSADVEATLHRLMPDETST